MNINGKIVTSMAIRLLDLLSNESKANVVQFVQQNMIHVIDIYGDSLRLSVASPGLLYRAKGMLSKEVDTIDWIDGFSGSDIFWDIGANVGVFSIYAAIRKKVKVFAFEPSAANFYALTQNIQLNKLEEVVQALCIALASQTSLGSLNLSSASMGAAANQFGRLGDRSPYASEGTAQVAHAMLGFTIDDFMRQFGADFPNHIKLDVDGLEQGILLGASVTLRDRRLKSIMVELGRDDSSEVIAMLESEGFVLEGIGDVQGIGDNRAHNHLFRRVEL